MKLSSTARTWNRVDSTATPIARMKIQQKETKNRRRLNESKGKRGLESNIYITMDWFHSGEKCWNVTVGKWDPTDLIRNREDLQGWFGVDELSWPIL